jgi:hypothetical protein
MAIRTLLTDDRDDRAAYDADFAWAFARLAEALAEAGADVASEMLVVVRHALRSAPGEGGHGVGVSDIGCVTAMLGVKVAAYWVFALRSRWEESRGPLGDDDYLGFVALSEGATRSEAGPRRPWYAGEEWAVGREPGRDEP